MSTVEHALSYQFYLDRLDDPGLLARAVVTEDGDLAVSAGGKRRGGYLQVNSRAAGRRLVRRLSERPAEFPHARCVRGDGWLVEWGPGAGLAREQRARRRLCCRGPVLRLQRGGHRGIPGKESIMTEPVRMPGDPQTDVSIIREDDGTIVAIFTAFMKAADLAAAFASLPADAWIADVRTVWISGHEGCPGQEVPDEEHDCPIVYVILEPEEAPSEVSS